MPFAIKKPVKIEYWVWNGTTDWSIAPQWLQNVVCHWGPNKLPISTLEGLIYASPGDYIIKGIKGEIYPCKKDIFLETYDLVETANETHK